VQKSLEQLAPFGYGNREPIFVSRNVVVREARLVGSEHLKLILSDGQTAWDAIAFRQGSWIGNLSQRIDVRVSTRCAHMERRDAVAVECERHQADDDR